MKRKAEYNLDREDFLRNGGDSPKQNYQQSNLAENLATPEEIAQRRIVKLKLPSGAAPQTGADKPAAKFELAGNFGTQQNGSAETEAPKTSSTPSFISNIVTSNTESKPTTGLFSSDANKTSESKSEEKKPSIFGNLGQNTNTSGTGLFTPGLFSTISSTPSTGGGLFSSIFPNSNKGFEGLAKKDYSSVLAGSGEKEEEEKPKAKTETKAPAKPSLFASLGEYKPTLFSNTASTGDKPSLFGNLGSLGGTGSFGALLAGGPKKDDGSDNEEEGEDDEPREPSPEADITKSKGNYTYQLDYEKIIGRKVTKCKPGNLGMLNEGEISLNKGQSGNYFIAYRNKAKVIQYQGNIFPKLSVITDLNPRGDAISVIAYSTEKVEEKKDEKKEGETDEAKKPKVSKDVIKLMFATSDECKEFKKELERVLEVTN